jgi:hypothetical protein
VTKHSNGKGTWLQTARELRAVVEIDKGIRGIPKSALPRGLACFGAPGVGKSRVLSPDCMVAVP